MELLYNETRNLTSQIFLNQHQHSDDYNRSIFFFHDKNDFGLNGLINVLGTKFTFNELYFKKWYSLLKFFSYYINEFLPPCLYHQLLVQLETFL